MFLPAVTEKKTDDGGGLEHKTWVFPSIPHVIFHSPWLQECSVYRSASNFTVSLLKAAAEMC